MSINGKNIHDIGAFLYNNLNFTIRIFIWDLANDLHICRKKKKKKKKERKTCKTYHSV